MAQCACVRGNGELTSQDRKCPFTVQVRDVNSVSVPSGLADRAGAQYAPCRELDARATSPIPKGTAVDERMLLYLDSTYQGVVIWVHRLGGLTQA